MKPEQFLETCRAQGGVNMQIAELIAANCDPDELDEAASRVEWSNFLQQTPVEDRWHGLNFWVTPKGAVYSVSHGTHSILIYDILGLSYDQVEFAGWVHCSDNKVRCLCPMTRAQEKAIETLSKLAPLHTRIYYNDRKPVPYEKAEKFDVRPGAERRVRKVAELAMAYGTGEPIGGDAYVALAERINRDAE